MAIYTYSQLTLEMWDKFVKEFKAPQPERKWIFCVNGKMVKEIYPHIKNIDEDACYMLEQGYPTIKVTPQKIKRKKKK